MAKTSDKLEKVDAAEENIDDILSNIKEVVTSASAPDSVLVLTEQVEEELEEASANDKAPAPTPAPEAPAPKAPVAPTITDAAQSLPKSPDILAQLDAGPEKSEKRVQVFPSEAPEEVTFANQATNNKAPKDNKANSQLGTTKGRPAAVAGDPQSYQIAELSEAPQVPDATLVRDDVAMATQEAISSMLSGNASEPQVATNQSYFASKTFEEVARALLRAELQVWLNANLEGMVRSIVESEIKRIMPK